MTAPASYLDLEESPVVRRDVYPATVTLPSGLEESAGYARERCLLVITTGAVYVWEGPDREPVFAQRLTGTVVLPSSFGLSGAEGIAPTILGDLRWVAGSGCKCGPLARYRPFPSPRRAP